MSVTLRLADEIDVSRGDMIARQRNQPHVGQDIEAMVCWMSESTWLRKGAKLAIKHTTRWARAVVKDLQYQLDVNTLHRYEDAVGLSLNEIGRVTLRTTQPLFYDEYRRNRTTGSFILVDEASNTTVGRRHDPRPAVGLSEWPTTSPGTRATSLAADRPSQGATIWFTGLSGSGKSTVATACEAQLIAAGRPAYVLDGDNIRHGLNGDLGFSAEDRAENVRRVGHVAA